MPISTRIFWAVILVAMDLMVFLAPLTAGVMVYVLIARPAWFKRFVDDLYAGT
ncbi:MAG: hypothetical protein WC352_02515 [Candidatus Omnitrophota bacterium]|jgi:hypothetical protein